MKLLLLISLVAGIAFNGQSNDATLKNVLSSPGKEKMQKNISQSASQKFFDPNSPVVVKNTHNAEYVTEWFKSEGEWGILQREILRYYPGSNLVKEIEHQFFDGIDDFTSFTNTVIQYDEKERPVVKEVYLSDDFGKAWRLTNKEIQVFDQHDEVILSEYYMEDWESGELRLVSGYKAEDTQNDNGTITERIWYIYDFFDWVPEHKETYTLNDNDVVTEIVYADYDEFSQTWEPDSRHVFTLNEKGEWSEALIYMAGYDYVKPIYLLGNGTEAGWNNQLALEMFHLEDSRFGIFATLRENGDLIKFISQLGQWAPQWGYGGLGDATEGTLSYRPSEAFPDPPAISIATLTPGDYIVLADTLMLTYEIQPFTDKSNYAWLEKNTKEDDWYLVYKVEDVKWYDFSKRKPEQMTMYFNTGLKSEPGKSKEKNEPVWQEYERGIWVYNETGAPLSEEYHRWLANQWMPDNKMVWTYDQLHTNTSMIYSTYIGGQWHTEWGSILHMSYNLNGSVLSYRIALWSSWENAFSAQNIKIYNYANHHSLVVVVNPPDGASVTGHGTYVPGSGVNLSATVNPGFTFQNWTDEKSNILGTNATFETTMPEHSVIIEANLLVQVGTYNILAGSFKIFPNPGRDHFTFSSDHQIRRLLIYDISGKVVYDREGINALEHRLAIPTIKPGIYIAKVITDNEIHTCKLHITSK